jgi:hypothetical protein
MADPRLTDHENLVRPVLERINNTPGRVGAAELQGTTSEALKAARAARLVGSSSWRGWFLTERGRLVLGDIREKAGIL